MPSPERRKASSSSPHHPGYLQLAQAFDRLDIVPPNDNITQMRHAIHTAVKLITEGKSSLSHLPESSTYTTIKKHLKAKTDLEVIMFLSREDIIAMAQENHWDQIINAARIYGMKKQP